MKSVEKVAEALNVTPEQASAILHNAGNYANKGKGLVFQNHKLNEEVAALFKQCPIWLSAELNAKVGWQFSQAVFWLRRAGWKIKTVSLGGHQFAYQLISIPEGE